MYGALAYYESRSRWNRISTRVTRLRQPKYLFGAIVGGFYFYWYVFGSFARRRYAARSLTGLTPEHQVLVEGIAALVLLVVLLLMWVIPHERAALTFTEAEVAFLFPAPISRRVLINFKLLKSQFAILFSAFFITLIRPWGGGNFLCRAIAWWAVLSVINLHLLGSSFARTLLLDHGISNRQRRLLVFGLGGLGLVGIILWVRQSLPPPPHFNLPQDLSAVADYARQLLESGPIPLILLPFHWVTAPIFAKGTADFCVALLPALLVIALHYCWVIWSNVSFEEASIEASRKFAQRIAAVQSGNWQAASKPKSAKRSPFELRPEGWPAVAIFWKNLISAGNFFTRRGWISLLWVFMVAAIAMQHTGRNSGIGVMVAFGALMLVVMSLFSGPNLLRHDFRQDLPIADILKMYPMAAWQVVLGEILAPVSILIGIQWLLLIVAAVLFTNAPNGSAIQPAWRMSIFVASALVLPFVDFIALLLPNATALIFPAWVQLGKNSPRGMETMGQQIILMFGQVLILALTLLPAIAAFGVAYFVTAYLTSKVVGVVVGAFAAATILAGETALGVLMLGRAFERFDWSDRSAE